MDWEHENVEPFCFDTDFDSEFDDDSLSEASWSFSRQSTTGSVSSLETLSASDPPVVTTALRFVAERWEEAQVVADIVAKTYKPPPRQIPPKAKEALASPLSVEGEDFLISAAPRHEVRPMFAGWPPANLRSEHDRVLSFAKLPEVAPGEETKASNCSRTMRESVVSSTSDEYEAVTRYFQATLGEKAEIHDLNRINVPKFRERFLTDGDHTIMFHGCRSSQNEASILEKGFRVASCVSGGTKFGTWFAYRADYSNRGYSFQDQDGLEHLFVCVVSYFYTVMDQALMRVVGQDCAYPQWLIRYRTARTPAYVPPVYAPPVVAGTSRPGKSTNRGRDRTWYVVRDGQWQLEGT